MNEAKVTCTEVRAGGEWGTFFVKEYPIVPRQSGGGVQAAAVFVAHTSRGPFAYRWSDMGESFGEFISNCDHGYILRKIGTKEISTKLAVSNVKREVLEARREKRITAEVAREAIETIDRAAKEMEGELLCHELYNASELSFIQDWCDISTLDYSHCTKVFMEKLWPEFVKQFNEQAAVTPP
jgi:hypothetical protein